MFNLPMLLSPFDPPRVPEPSPDSDPGWDDETPPSGVTIPVAPPADDDSPEDAS